LFEFDHGRDELIERAGGLAAMAAVLLFGFSIGAMWVGAAFGAEWHQQQLGGENRGQLVSDGEETHNHD